MVTTLFIDFSDAQGQLTSKSVMESCRNSNSSGLLWLVLLHARKKKIHPKLKVLEWSQHIYHHKSMGIFPDAKGQILISPWFDPAEFLAFLEFLMVGLVACKNDQDPSKNEGTRVVTTYLPL